MMSYCINLKKMMDEINNFEQNADNDDGNAVFLGKNDTKIVKNDKDLESNDSANDSKSRRLK